MGSKREPERTVTELKARTQKIWDNFKICECQMRFVVSSSSYGKR